MDRARLLHLRSVLTRTSTALGCIALALTISRCIAEDAACSEHQVPASDELYTCKCAPGYVPNEELGYGCVACKSNEVEEKGECVCKPGYARPDADSKCEKVEGSLIGSDCSEDMPCTDPNPHCALTESPAYCTTQGCTKNDDCPTKWLCDRSGAESFCKKPPEGLGESCQTAADCGETAPYCEAFQTHTCIINDCLMRPSLCPSGMVCCDLTALIQESFCVDTSVLMNGLCPGGLKPVTE